MPKWLVNIIVVLVICFAAYHRVDSLQDSSYAQGYDDGALRIINKIKVNENINYSALDGMDYMILLKAEEPVYYQHEQELLCMICHIDAINYQEGGN